MDELDLIRRRVIAVVGHELRTPVTTLRGLAEQMVNAGPPDTRALLAAALERNARRLESLLDDLLLAGEINTALPVGDPEPTDVRAAAQATWTALGPGMTLDFEGPERVMALSRPGSLERILHHLFDNAIRYGVPPFTVYARLAEPMVEIDVHSPGEGISDYDLAFAFELFYRGERAVTIGPGLGIGLPAARALARHDGGDLELTRRSKGGVVMHLRVPAT